MDPGVAQGVGDDGGAGREGGGDGPGVDVGELLQAVDGAQVPVQVELVLGGAGVVESRPPWT